MKVYPATTLYGPGAFGPIGCIWASLIRMAVSRQVIVTETRSTSVIIYTTVQITSTVTSSCGPNSSNTSRLPFCSQVVWTPISDIGLGSSSFGSFALAGTAASPQPLIQSNSLGAQTSGGQGVEGGGSSTGGGSLSQVSSAAKLGQPQTASSVQADQSTAAGAADAPATPYSSPFPIGGRGKLRNLAVELSPGGLVIFREASDSPQEFINDEAGYIRPVSNPDLVLYIHYDNGTDLNQRGEGVFRNSSGTVLNSVRAKAQNSTDSYDIENTFIVDESGIRLRGTNDHAEYLFYIGDYESDNQRYRDRVLKLIAAPVTQTVDLEKYKVEEVTLLPFIVRSTGTAATESGADTSESVNGNEGASAAAASISSLYEIITASSLIPFCSEYLSHTTITHTKPAASHLSYLPSVSTSIPTETSVEKVAVSTTTVTVESGVTTKPWPIITSLADGGSDEEINYGSDTNVYPEGEATIFRRYPLPRHLKRSFDIPDILSIYNPSQISEGCSEVIYKTHHSTLAGEISTHAPSMTVVVVSGSTLTYQIDSVETFTTTIPSVTITPTPMSGRILMYDRGEYSTDPGSLSATYLAPTTIHTSISKPTVVAELARADSGSVFHLDGFGRLYSIHPYTGFAFYWAEKVKEGGREEIAKLGVGDFVLVPEQEIDGYILNFVTFWVEEDGRIMIDEVYSSENLEIESTNAWEFIWCYDRPGTLWNYNTARKYRDEGGQNSELTDILNRRDNSLEECSPQTLTFMKLDGETAADDIMYLDILRRDNE
ncbi:hypothetical protein TWF481_003219 [Arthrobotrys musiformis]|uniref:Uncharacterized protein n=1 Tax=Arthrobotrys musiformis TaxID=47236 RepID=A0AAV9VQN3_9PEZI